PALVARSDLSGSTPPATDGAAFPQKITNRTKDALCIDSSNCSICQIFPESKTRCGRMQKGELRLRRRSSLILKRKCGSRGSVFSRCANFGDGNWETNTSSSYRK